MISVRWLRGLDEFELHGETLRLLAQRSGRDLPFADPDFLTAYVQHFEYCSTPPTPELLLASDATGPIGFLATRLTGHEIARGVSVRERSLLVTHDHDRLTLVCDPARALEVADAIAGELLTHPGATAIDIAALEPGSALHMALHRRAARSARWTAFDIELPPFCTVAVKHDSLAAYFSSLAKTMRSNVSRQARRLFAAGEVQLVFARGADQVAPLFPALLDLESRSWKAPAKAGMLRSPRRTAFFREVVEGNAAYRPGFVGVVLDGTLIAGLLLGHQGKSSWALEMSFDQTHSDLGAGQLLLLLAMHDAIEHHSSALGFFQHFSYFKKRWLADEVAVVSTRVVRTGSPVHLRHLAAVAQRSWRARWNKETEPVVTALAERLLPETPGPAEPVDDRDERFAMTAQGRAEAEAASRAILAAGVGGATLLDRAAAASLLPFALN